MQPVPRAPTPSALLAALFALALATALGATGCAPDIGDSCDTSVNCDVNGTRICDLAQPGGYCTVEYCESGTCPAGSVCVQFEPTPSRLARTWCMASCTDDSDCRTDEGYGCRAVTDAPLCNAPTPCAPEASLAQVLDEGQAGARFCTAVR